MRIVVIRNNTQEEKIWLKTFFPAEEYSIPLDSPALLVKYANHDPLLSAISSGEASIGNGSIFFTTLTEQLNWLMGNIPIEADIKSSPPFANPTHRTKNDATSTMTYILPAQSGTVDYYLTANRSVTGGEMIIENAALGDYVTAEVIDIDGVIPVPYRTTLCENHPIVAKYVIKRWVMPANAQGFSFCQLDTRPLTAKITAGLYLRVTYNSVSGGLTRCIGVNYYLTQEL